MSTVKNLRKVLKIWDESWLRTGIHGLTGPRTKRSELVRDFQNFVGPGLVRDFQICLGPGPVRYEGSFFRRPGTIWSQIWNFVQVLVRFRILRSFWSGLVPWIGKTVVTSSENVTMKYDYKLGSNTIYGYHKCPSASQWNSFFLILYIKKYLRNLTKMLRY